MAGNTQLLNFPGVRRQLALPKSKRVGFAGVLALVAEIQGGGQGKTNRPSVATNKKLAQSKLLRKGRGGARLLKGIGAAPVRRARLLGGPGRQTLGGG